MTQPVAMTVEAGLAAEQDLMAAVCAGEREYGLLFWQPSGSEEHTSELQSRLHLVCRLLLETKD